MCPPEQRRRQRRSQRGLSRALEGWQLAETHETNRAAFFRLFTYHTGAVRWLNRDEMKESEFCCGGDGGERDAPVSLH